MYEQPYNPYRGNIAIVKDYFKSPSVLVLAIMNIAAMVLSVISSLVSQNLTREITSQIANFFDKNILSDSSNQSLLKEISEALHDVASSGIDIMSVFGSVSAFSILTVVGIMLVYFKSRSENPDAAPTAGFTMLYVVAVLTMVCAIMLAVGMGILAVVLFFLYTEAAKNPEPLFAVNISGESIRIDATIILILAIVLTVMFIFIAFITLFFTINHVRYLKSVRDSMNTVELSRKGAKPYGVFCVIAAVSTGLSLISSVSSLLVDKETVLEIFDISIDANLILPSIVAIISSAVSMVIFILQAKIALGYASYIDEKKYGYSEPPAPTPYAPIGVGSNTQPNPYSYLAQPKTEVRPEDATFVNPYLDTKETTVEPKPPTCPNCGAPVDGSAPFCGQCGTKL